MCANLGTLFICSKFDTDVSSNVCRLGFFGNAVAIIGDEKEFLVDKQLKIFREKVKEGVVEKICDNYTIIIRDMFKKESKIETFVNKNVFI
jgi:selenocysteine-specific elongation factor